MSDMWMVRAGTNAFLINDFLENNVVAIGWDVGDLSSKTEYEIKKIVEDRYSYRKGSIPQYSSQIMNFVHNLKIGDYVISYDKNTKTFYLGEITSNYYYKRVIDKEDPTPEGSYYDHIRDVKWIGQFKRSQISENNRKSLGGRTTVFHFKESFKNEVLSLFNKKSSSNIIKKDFEKILHDYPIAKRDYGTTDAPIAYYIKNEFRNHFKEVINEDEWYINSNAGAGRLSQIPWIDFSNNNYWDGYNVAYFFKSDMSGFYLTLRVVFNNDVLNEHENINNYLKNKSESIRDFLNQFNKFDEFDKNIDLKSTTDLAEKHEISTIFAKYYDKNNVPNDDILIKDLNNFLEINKFIDLNYMKKTTNDTIEKEIMEGNQMNFYNYLKEESFLFEPKTIENYLLSLKTKPFVILTGNSGTGKTKLSQLFAKYLESLKYQEFEEDSEYVDVKVTTKRSSFFNSSKGKQTDPGWTITNEYFYDILPLDKIVGKYDIDFDGITTKGTIRSVIQIYYSKESEDLKEYFRELYYKEQSVINSDKSNGIKHIGQLVNLGINKDSIRALIKEDFIPIENISFVTNFRKGVTDTLIDNREFIIPFEVFDYLPLNNKVNCEIKCGDLTANARIIIKFNLKVDKDEEVINHLKELQRKGIKSCNFTIKGLNPSLEDVKPSFYDSTLNDIQRNYEIVPVGANWTDNRNILGYENIITKSYQSTQALELIIKAKNNPNQPFFLILDEMNLSHVERYFSDFLSAIESGEKIPLYTSKMIEFKGESVLNEDLYKINIDGEEYPIPPKLEIPSNLFIIGTVNVDETTYMFSPKVLDRSNVLEFDTYPVEKYLNQSKSNEYLTGDFKYLENLLTEDEPRNWSISDLNDKLDSNLWINLSKELDKFQVVLEDAGFDFGFRVTNEILRFVAISNNYYGNNFNWEDTFDVQIKQKLLPKLHGPENVIGDTLNNLLKLCYYGEEIKFNRDNDSITQKLKEYEIPKEDLNPKYKESYIKISKMLNVLEKQRYVSFIN